jgi:hypothetical protein
MMRKMFLTAAALTALTLGPALAQTYELDIAAQLREQGYQNITLSHTWLGRTRIVALLGSDLREIVLDPNTGEILRDLSRTVMAEGGTGRGNDAMPGSGSATVASAGSASAGSANGGNPGTVRTTAGVAAATSLDGQVTTSATVGISTASGGIVSPVGGGSASQPNVGTLGNQGQAGLPFQILGPAGGQ